MFMQDIIEQQLLNEECDRNTEISMSPTIMDNLTKQEESTSHVTLMTSSLTTPFIDQQ